MKGVDLQREDRIKKCDACIEQILSIFKSSSLTKATTRKSEVRLMSNYLKSVSSLAKQLFSDLESFSKSINL
jgi:hypothetical protein